MVSDTQKTPDRGDRLEPLYYFGELARAYVPPQVYGERFSPAEGLRRGTIFPELVRPYQYQGR